MSNNKKRDDIDESVEFVYHLTNFISDSGDQSDDELSQELKSFGINFSTTVAPRNSAMSSSCISSGLFILKLLIILCAFSVGVIAIRIAS